MSEFESDGKDRETSPPVGDQPEEPESAIIMHRQPTVNIMMIGHVNNGKSTLSRALSGEKTGKFKKELEENRTIYLGYTSFKIFFCANCPTPDSYQNYPSKTMRQDCPQCGEEMKLLRHVSVVDCPGHSELMGTMLSGASVVDAALLVVSAATTCPAPQTREHMSAARLLGIVEDNLIVVQNKVDLVSEARCCQHMGQVLTFLEGFDCPSVPIIPVCAQQEVNIDALCMAIGDLPIPRRETNCDLMMTVIRSFDVNRSGCPPQDLRGGVAGCVVSSGVLRVGERVEIRPGWAKKKGKRKWIVVPVVSVVVSAQCGNRQLEQVYPGANVGVGLTVDPWLTQKNRMVGCVIGSFGSESLPPVFVEAKMFVVTLGKFGPFLADKTEDVRVNIGAFQSQAKVRYERMDGKDGVVVELARPCCASIGARVAISRRRGKGEEWRLDAGAVVWKVRVLPLEVS